MGTSNYSDEFKLEAVKQLRVRGQPNFQTGFGLGWVKSGEGPVPLEQVIA